MKRKLIAYDVFKKINEESLSSAGEELSGVETVLAKVLDADNLSLKCFGESTVTYETADSTFVYAGYRFDNGHIILENIEELVIDNESAKTKSRGLLSTMVNELLNSNEIKANSAFEQYMALPAIRKSLLEGKSGMVGDKMNAKKSRARRKSKSLINGDKRQSKARRDSIKRQFGKASGIASRFKKKVPEKQMKEWMSISESVLGYLEHEEFGPVMSQVDYKQDDKGNVTSVRIPVTRVRNENKLLNFNWKTMKTDLEVLRGKIKRVSENAEFCRAVADLRKYNAMSDAEATQTTCENIIKAWPEIIYLTQEELARAIGESLQSIGEKNFDDESCKFMAEGILHTASEAYPERVKRIVNLAGVELDKDDSVYEAWQHVVSQFYPKLDENSRAQTQVFANLYSTLVEINKIAVIERNDTLRSETNGYLTDLYAVLQNEREPTLQLAGEVATWLSDLVEANIEYASDNWKVSNTPSMVYPGDNPQMAKNAKVPGTPGLNPGDWGSPAPVSDGKSYKGGLDAEMRNKGFGNWSDSETWPELQNPLILKPFDYKMKEPSAANAGESDWGRWQSKDTWPNLTNPLQSDPQSANKMKSDDLVIDK